ncbi:MAG: protein translocase subunit SecD [Waddliaceae bacterium]
MEKQKRWQFWVIIAVISLTLINILPTVFYYSRPLKSPILEQDAKEIGTEIVNRVNQQENDSRDWIFSFTKHLGIQPKKIEFDQKNPGQYVVEFNNEQDALVFQRFLPRAGNLISFVPAQLDLEGVVEDEPTKVIVARQLTIHPTSEDTQHLFHYVPKLGDQNEISNDYLDLIGERSVQIIQFLGSGSSLGETVEKFISGPNTEKGDDQAGVIAREIVEWATLFDGEHPATKRFLAQLTIGQKVSPERLSGELVNRLQAALDRIDSKIQKPSASDELTTLENKQRSIKNAIAVLKARESLFNQNLSVLTRSEALNRFEKTADQIDLKDPIQYISLDGTHPLFQQVVIDWGAEKIRLQLYEDIASILNEPATSETKGYRKERLRQFVLNEVARLSRETEESATPVAQEFAIDFHQKSNPQSFLLLDLGVLAQKQLDQLNYQLNTQWQPQHPDLQKANYPILTKEQFDQLPASQKKLGFVLYAPNIDEDATPSGFRNDSIYIIARGLDSILQKYQDNAASEDAQILQKDLNKLTQLLAKQGYIAYPGNAFGIDQAFDDDYLFEKSDYSSTFIKATRENFHKYGKTRYAVLELTDKEQRLLARNQILDSAQENLVKWSDEYEAAQADINVIRHYEVPPPTKNVYLENLRISLFKFFQGDDRKILKWGLDLSGGKTVRIGLRDQNGRKVTDTESLNQAVNELYTRINKMGVSERTIRIENENIILDFPGSQAFSAEELIKSSAMYFHIVNEKFTPTNSEIGSAVNQFLQDVWNEAVVTNRKDAKSINEIAWRQLGGEEFGITGRPASEHAKVLVDNGLHLASPKSEETSSALNDSVSKIAILRGNELSQWYGQTHPLLFVFNNFALEGSNLTDVRVGYDPSEGNILSFQIKGSYSGKREGSPSDNFHSWTSQFSEDQILGTPKEEYSSGRGWRMAVVLNDSVVTMPLLRAALRDSGTISGRFSQREITELAADLKAGSLSFTPEILSEENVSPELGKSERNQGIMATVIGLVLVAAAMIGYYRFAGVVATCAVFLNILIIWAVLQSMGAALTLAGLAGIILTIGMAVDANVLVFERIREEFRVSGRIASAIHAGYSKAFSAIVDSNITTIIAAFILTQFDSGPIKGFAVTLIIGIVSSMFTALFMTRYYFAGWVQNPKHTELKMSNWIHDTQIDFLRYAKPVIIGSLSVIVIGGFLFFTQRHTILGMDFTGGYALYAQVEEQEGIDSYRKAVETALIQAGAASTDVEIRALSKPNHLRIQLGMGMEESGRPYHQLPLVSHDEDVRYEYQKDPRIDWVVEALQTAGLPIQESDLTELDSNWTMMSGQFSDAMRTNAIYALSLALLSILIYITIRFEFKYAIAAVIALAHTVAVTLAILAIFHQMELPVQIDLVVVGAIMTIIGYSLNDTIIIFDRIREDAHLMYKRKLTEVINHALNVTLSRTLMTSGTTLLVLLSLVFFGGSSILDFSLVMTIGVIVGTYSSIFLAAPLMLYFNNLLDENKDQSSTLGHTRNKEA